MRAIPLRAAPSHAGDRMIGSGSGRTYRHVPEVTGARSGPKGCTEGSVTRQATAFVGFAFCSHVQLTALRADQSTSVTLRGAAGDFGTALAGSAFICLRELIAGWEISSTSVSQRECVQCHSECVRPGLRERRSGDPDWLACGHEDPFDRWEEAATLCVWAWSSEISCVVSRTSRAEREVIPW
jgi:hypothetical protein